MGLANLAKRAYRRAMTLGSLPPDTDNVEHNRALWNRYSKRWDSDYVSLEDTGVQTPEERERAVRLLGDEWGNSHDLDTVLEDFLFPFVDENAVVAEIGVGGGRVASRVSPRVRHLHCFDLSVEMLSRARRALAGESNVSFYQVDGPQLPGDMTGSFDFVYSFDVFPHLDLHTIWKYLQEIQRVLKPGGRSFLHTSNLRAPGGWENFSKQERYSVIGHYFVTPDLIELLAERARLTLEKQSQPDPSNYYYNRDFLCVLSKTA